MQQTSSSVNITLMLSNSVMVESGSECFIRKLTFVSGSNHFMPTYPGTCEFSSSASNMLSGSLDIRDYVHAFTSFEILRTMDNSEMIIDAGSAASFLPGISVQPIVNPLRASGFTSYEGGTSLVSFDIDFNANTLLLHFNGLVDTQGIVLGNLMLTRGISSTAVLPVPSQLSATQRYVASLCIPLSNSYLDMLMMSDICQTSSSCFCFFGEFLLNDYTFQSVNAVRQSMAIQVLHCF